MFTHKCVSRTLCMYFILIGLTGTCFMYILLADWSHKTERLPLFYVNLQKGIVQMPFRSSHFIHHRGSRHYNECELVYATKTDKCDIDPMSYYFNKYNNIERSNTYMTQKYVHENVTPLSYSEDYFRNASYPVLWLDAFGDVRWNEAAEHEMYQLLLDKQFPKLSNVHIHEANDYINDCESRHLILLEQWTHGGFFSRANCLIEQFGQSLYSPFMAVLLPRQFDMGSAGTEDFMHEGILGYYASMSQCSAYIVPHRLKNISESVENLVQGEDNHLSEYIKIETFGQLRQVRSRKRYLWLQDQWKFGYEHVPHRRWLFDRKSRESKTFVHYDSSIDILMEHSLEHIYHAPNLNFNLEKWEPRNAPVLASTTNLSSNYKIIWKDKVFTSFLRYIFTIFFHQFAPRIELSKNLLTRYWSSYLADNKNQPYYQALSSMAVVYIRRGDHTREDPFYQKYGYWRNLSLFLETLYDEEKRLNKTFSSIFILSDDGHVVNSAIEFASKYSSGPDERFARQYLFGRDVIYNINAPQNCRKPLSRFDFDQYVVSIQLIIRHSAIVVTQILSNLGTYLEAILFAQNQLIPNHQTTTRIKYVHDHFLD